MFGAVSGIVSDCRVSIGRLFVSTISGNIELTNNRKFGDRVVSGSYLAKCIFEDQETQFIEYLSPSQESSRFVENCPNSQEGCNRSTLCVSTILMSTENLSIR